MHGHDRGWATLLAVGVVVGLLLAAGCARSPEAKKARYLERGDRYFQKERYRDAILEYRNALRLDASNPRAVRQLGLAHFQLAEIGQALRYLLKAQEQSPDDLDVRLKIGAIFHGIGKMDEARQEAEFVLAKDPKN